MFKGPESGPQAISWKRIRESGGYWIAASTPKSRSPEPSADLARLPLFKD